MKPGSVSVVLGASAHGKSRVRVAKVRRGADGVHEFVELSVRVELSGGADASFARGDNRAVVATDTCKNHVYMRAKAHDCASPDAFAADLARSLLADYPHLASVAARVVEKPWRRAAVDGRRHAHGFVRALGGMRAASAEATRARDGSVLVLVTSELLGLDVLKTTQSGWSNFHQSHCTTLPDTDERILATTITASWTYLTVPDVASYSDVHSRVRAALMQSFFGPPAEGEFSRGVQETMFKMGRAVIEAVPGIEKITLDMPNLHFLPTNTLPVFVKNDVPFEDDVYIPTDEPHGVISATIHRETTLST